MRTRLGSKLTALLLSVPASKIQEPDPNVTDSSGKFLIDFSKVCIRSCEINFFRDYFSIFLDSIESENACPHFSVYTFGSRKR